MQPRWHLIFGAIFTIIIWLSIPNISYIYLGLIFLASIFIDLDHYANAIIRTGKFGPIEMLRHYDKIGKVWDSNHKKGKKIPGYFQPFHTTEAHLIVFLLGFVWAGFYFIFIGMFFHVAKREIINRTAEKMSTTLRASPENTNNPLRNNIPIQNRLNWSQGVIPNTNNKKAMADKMSTNPRTFTNTINIS